MEILTTLLSPLFRLDERLCQESGESTNCVGGIRRTLHTVAIRHLPVMSSRLYKHVKKYHGPAADHTCPLPAGLSNTVSRSASSPVARTGHIAARINQTANKRMSAKRILARSISSKMTSGGAAPWASTP